MTVVAALFTSPLATLPILLGVPFYWFSTRRYLKHAADGYLWERATYAQLNGVVAETVDGARTIDALVARPARAGSRFHEALRECYRGRALHARPAAALVPVGRVRLLRADRRRGALGRLAGHRTATSPPARPPP